MKFPYGISDFKKVNTQGYYYCEPLAETTPINKATLHNVPQPMPLCDI